MSLIWELTKKSSCFIVKQGIETFTKDPFSLTNRNTKSDSGLTNDMALCPTYTLQDGKKHKKGKVEKYHVLLKHPKKFRGPEDPKQKPKKPSKYGKKCTFAQQYEACSVKEASTIIKSLVNPAIAKKGLIKLAHLHEAAQMQKKYKPIKKVKKENK